MRIRRDRLLLLLFFTFLWHRSLVLRLVARNNGNNSAATAPLGVASTIILATTANVVLQVRSAYYGKRCAVMPLSMRNLRALGSFFPPPVPPLSTLGLALLSTCSPSQLGAASLAPNSGETATLHGLWLEDDDVNDEGNNDINVHRKGKLSIREGEGEHGDEKQGSVASKSILGEKQRDSTDRLQTREEGGTRRKLGRLRGLPFRFEVNTTGKFVWMDRSYSAFLLAREGKLVEAAKEYAFILSSFKARMRVMDIHDMYIRLGEIHLTMGQDKEARKCFRDALITDDEGWSGNFHLGLLRARQVINHRRGYIGLYIR